MDFEFGDDPSKWMCHGGKPAAVVPFDGMPSYESDHGTLLVFDLLVVNFTRMGECHMLSRWYGAAALVAPGGLVPLHTKRGGVWSWRPRIYYKSLSGWTHMGSQQELSWRHGLSLIQHIRFGHLDMESFDMDEADARAAKILRENLTPMQRLELAARGAFRVRGGKTRNMYHIEPGNGFTMIDPATAEPVLSYCLHPDDWVPHDDVALGLKFALEDPELEEDCLTRGRSTFRGRARRPTRMDFYVRDMEKELIT